MTADDAPLLAAENDDEHPQEVAAVYGDVRIILIDSARYCDGRNGNDVVVAGSYCGTLPARLMAPHRPVGVIGHDVGIAADGSGISGLPYLEALGIPAAAVAGATSELGNGRDMYENGSTTRSRSTFGYAKQGAGFAYSGVKGLNALLATVSTASSAPVIVATWLRKGSANSARGAARSESGATMPCSPIRRCRC